MVVFRGREEGQMERGYLMCTQSWFCKMRTFWRPLAQLHECTNTTELINGSDVKFYFVFYDHS